METAPVFRIDRAGGQIMSEGKGHPGTLNLIKKIEKQTPQNVK